MALANRAGIVVIVVQPFSLVLFRGLKEQIGMTRLGKLRSQPHDATERSQVQVTDSQSKESLQSERSLYHLYSFLGA